MGWPHSLQDNLCQFVPSLGLPYWQMGPMASAYWQSNTQLPMSKLGQKKMKKMNIKRC